MNKIKKPKKPIFVIAICIGIILTALSIVAFAASDPAVKTYTDTSNGNNVKYTMTNETTLKITGSGTITNIWQDKLYTKNHASYYYGDLHSIIIEGDKLIACDKNAFGTNKNGLIQQNGTKAYHMEELFFVNISKYNKAGNYAWNSLAFQGNKELRELTLGNYCYSIPEGSFKNCTNLYKVSKSTKITVIPKEAFMNAPITEFTNMKVVTEIQESAFENTDLMEVDLTNTITIGDKAFKNCDQLQSVTIKKATTIGKEAFYKCVDLATIGENNGNVNSLLPITVNSIGENCFYNCRSMTRLRIQNTECSIYDSPKTIHDTTTIVGYGEPDEDTTAKKYADKYARLFFHYSAESTYKEKLTAWQATAGSENFGAIYRFECYGAKGGNSKGNSCGTEESKIGTGSVGSYTSACIQLLPGESLYIYAGRAGGSAGSASNAGVGGWNGGGAGTVAANSWKNDDNETLTANSAGGGGGGATDIRTYQNGTTSGSGKWSNGKQDNRIMVAAGGAGASYRMYINSTTGKGGGGNAYPGGDGASSNGKLFSGSVGVKYTGKDGANHPVANASGGGGGGFHGGATTVLNTGNKDLFALKGTNHINPNTFEIINLKNDTTRLTKFMEEGDPYYKDIYKRTATAGGGSESDGYCIVTVEEIITTKIRYHSNNFLNNNDEVIEAKFKLKETDYTILDCLDYDEFSTGIFLGWNTERDGSGTTYMPNDVYKSDNDLDLYAMWLTVDLELTSHGSYEDYDGMYDAIWTTYVGTEAGDARTLWTDIKNRRFTDTDVTYSLKDIVYGKGNDSGKYEKKNLTGKDIIGPDHIEKYRDLITANEEPPTTIEKTFLMTKIRENNLVLGIEGLPVRDTAAGHQLGDDSPFFSSTLKEVLDIGTIYEDTVTATKQTRKAQDTDDVEQVSGVAKYYYKTTENSSYINSKSDNIKWMKVESIDLETNFNNFIIDTSDNYEKYKENEYFWLTVVAEDKEGNLGTSISFKVDIEVNKKDFDINTKKLSVSSELTTTLADGTTIFDNVYKATGNTICDTYYVRADGTSPFIIDYSAEMTAPSAYMSKLIGFNNWNITENTLSGLTELTTLTPKQKFQSFPPVTNNSSAIYDNNNITKNNITGDNWGKDISNTVIKRFNEEANLKKVTTMAYPMTVAPEMNGIIRYIRPFASGKYTITSDSKTVEEIVNSNPTNEEIIAGIDKDEDNTIRIIPDGEGPEVKNLNDIYKFSRLNSESLLAERTCTIEAEDSLSGIRSIKVEIFNLDNGKYKVYYSQGDSVEIRAREDEIWYIGEFIVKVTTTDNVGNVTEVSQRAYSTDLDAELFRILAPHDNIFQAGESGTISIKTEGYIDKLKLEFSIPVTPYEDAVYPDGYSVSFDYIDADDDSVPVKYKKIKEMYIYCDFDEIETEEAGTANPKIDFMVPVYTAEGTYSVKVRAYKNDEELTYLEKDLPFIVQGTILDDFRTRIRSAN